MRDWSWLLTNESYDLDKLYKRVTIEINHVGLALMLYYEQMKFPFFFFFLYIFVTSFLIYDYLEVVDDTEKLQLISSKSSPPAFVIESPFNLFIFESQIRFFFFINFNLVPYWIFPIEWFTVFTNSQQISPI